MGLSQEKLALQAGIDRTLVSKIERGLGNPTLVVLDKVSSILGVGICDLLCPPLDRYHSKQVNKLTDQ